MSQGAKRFRTTHTGSLPRPDDLTRVMFAKEEGIPIDHGALDARIEAAVHDVVKRQVDLGIDTVNDGEYSKPSYTTYIKDRLTGFDGTSEPLVYGDLVDFPSLQRRVFGDPGRSRRRTPACTGPIEFADTAAVETDICNLQHAIAAAGADQGFLTAASPGVIALFFRNDYYPSRVEYVHAIAEAMRTEYEMIAGAGLILQIDCPDLGMGRHIQFTDRTLEDFRTEIALNIDALNDALANIPPERTRLHLCWGNYEGPHHLDVPLEDIVDLVLGARPAGLSLEAANPRHAHEWEVFKRISLPDGKLLIPGVVESTSNYIEHPALIAQRIGRYASLVGRDNVVAGGDCGFGTWVGQAAVDPAVVWSKLAAMADGARLAGQEFWG